MRFLAISAGIAAAIFAMTAYFQRDPDLPDINFLAQDIFFQLNSARISVPAIALISVSVPPANLDPLPTWRTRATLWGSERQFPTNKYKDTLLELAGEKSMALDLNSIWLDFGSYGTQGEHLMSHKICPLFTQKWSQDMCANERAQYGIPARFRLETEEGLAIYDSMSFSDFEHVRGSDLIDEIEPFTTRTKVGCTDDQMYCLAGINILEDVHAVWSVSCRGMDMAACGHASKAQGDAISNFVRTELMFND